MATPAPRQPEVPADISGRLLIATPVLRDGVFDDTVVFVLAHGDDGTIGVVLNHPLDMSVADTMTAWDALADAPRVLFGGGPVEESTLVGVAMTEADAEGFARVPGPLSCCTVDLELDTTEAASHVKAMRIFAGYSGWGPGQLAGEILAGAWFVADARPNDIYTDAPESLWERVLRRQPNSSRWFVNYPADPQFN